MSADGPIFSASDLVNFLGCEHLTLLELDRLRADEHQAYPRQADADDAGSMAKLLKELGMAHERAYLEKLRAEGRSIVELAGSSELPTQAQKQQTLAALQSGRDVIYQALLSGGSFAGYSDFLERVDEPSILGDFSYEVVDTKLSRSAKGGYLVQLCFYSSLLGVIQRRMPRHMHIVLGDNQRATYPVADYIRYFNALSERFLAAQETNLTSSYPTPCAKCGECRWEASCTERWIRDDHLTQVANIRSSQIRKLTTASVSTMAALGILPDDARIPKLGGPTLDTLRHQARLQVQARTTGERIADILPQREGGPTGFALLPEPSAHDLYFDMEGDPLTPGGLEYLFGLGHVEGGELVVRAFWAHDRAGEKAAFEALVDAIQAHITRHPGAHVYHYAAYEKTALGRLMSMHATREREVDDFFRRGVLVDLYKVVREGLRISEPSYSIKSVERFYRPPREGDVQEAGASIVYYDRWRQTGDAALLASIEAYNRDDVDSTAGLHRWLLGLRPPEMQWRQPAAPLAEPSIELDHAAEALQSVRNALKTGLPTEGAPRDANERLREMALHLMDFHRREQKPAWWKYFDCLQMSAEELIDDAECLGGLERDDSVAPVPVKKSRLVTYTFPTQDSKLRTGVQACRTDTGKDVLLEFVDADACVLRIKFGPNAEAPAHLGLGPPTPINDRILRAATAEFAANVATDLPGFAALKSLLSKSMPRIRDMAPGEPIVAAAPTMADIADAVSRLDDSYLVIQGPPGTGKTYTGSRVIVELLRRGRSVGVTSNSHKAIENLLSAVEAAAKSAGVEFRGFKKGGAGPGSGFDSDAFDCSTDIADYDPRIHRLFAGTAWAFAALDPDTPLDYVFVDEAGQLSLGHLVAAGSVARNIVLLGDQMQLGQPIQGSHPGRSGESCLEYLMDDRPTIPVNEGVFLADTYRMHPAVCEFISEAVYEGRLRPTGIAPLRRLVSRHPTVPSAGIRFVGVDHIGCSQSSPEEADTVAALYRDLLSSSFDDGVSGPRAMTTEDILVVSPFILQVNLLTRRLPDGARVGTVDKFQGQEAPAVIVSMATSSAEELPRDIEFLFSKNRLNVAISRAQCTAFLVSSPALLTIPCDTPMRMALVNTLCWVRDYSNAQTDCDPGNQASDPIALGTVA
jgi:uncharacterized protein